MIKDQLEKLKGVNSSPCVSIIIPTHRKFPASKQNPTIMKNGIKKIKDLLFDKFQKREAERYMEEIMDLEGEINYNNPTDAMGLFLSDKIKEIVYLPFTAKETAIVDNSFQVRDLIYTLNRSFNYNVILLSEKNTRIFHGLDDKVTEYFPKDLPKSSKEYVDGPLMDDNRYSYQDVEIFNENVKGKFFADIDEFISKNLGKKKNLILMGVTDHLAEFQKISKNKDKIYMTEEGNYDHFKEHEIAELLRPKIIEKIEDEKSQKMDELEKAISEGKYESGISQVWRAVMSKRARILLVEKDYFQSAKKGEDEFTIHIAEEDADISDAVDDIVEKMSEDEEEIYFVEKDALEKHQKIAVITKY